MKLRRVGGEDLGEEMEEMRWTEELRKMDTAEEGDSVYRGSLLFFGKGQTCL